MDSLIFKISTVGRTVIVQETNDFCEGTIVKDSLKSSVNGNYCYAADFYDKNGKQINYTINGWTVRQLGFPGDWFDNCIHVILVDRFGYDYNLWVRDKREVYPDHRESMIRRAMEAVIEYSKSPFVKYNEFMKGLSVDKEMSISRANTLINHKIIEYFEMYESVLELLDTMDDKKDLIEKVKQSFFDNLDKLRSVKIIEPEQPNK